MTTEVERLVGPARWLPMESAPRDGSRMILRHMGDVETEGYWKYQWRDWRDRKIYPTQWMPLPNTELSRDAAGDENGN